MQDQESDYQIAESVLAKIGPISTLNDSRHRRNPSGPSTKNVKFTEFDLQKHMRNPSGASKAYAKCVKLSTVDL